ncbi:MAG: hypothetical protein AB8G26_15175 [Ilumatobacter sp.]
MPSDLDGGSDEAYGLRVFLHHYCVHLSGPDVDGAMTPFTGDRRAARGFNGDIARHHSAWIEAVGTAHPAELGRRVSRKTLLAVAGLVSVNDNTWTTDRELATRRWSVRHPSLRAGLEQLLAWTDGDVLADDAAVEQAVRGAVSTIVEQFAADIGLWS